VRHLAKLVDDADTRIAQVTQRLVKDAQRVGFDAAGGARERNHGFAAGQLHQLLGVRGPDFGRPAVDGRERILRLHYEETRRRLPEARMQVMIRARGRPEFGDHDLVQARE